MAARRTAGWKLPPRTLDNRRRTVIWSCIAAVALTGSLAIADPLRVTGWVERVAILEAGLVLDAKLDTGADHSSLNARNIVLEERAGVPWVRFALRDRHGQSTVMTLPVQRQAKVKRAAGAAQRRPVVKLTLCLDGHHHSVDVNLVNRAGLDYPLLVGRSFLRSQFLIDAGRQYLTKPDCVLSRASD